MRKALILIAEDDPDDRFFLESAFLETGDPEELVFVQNGIDLLQFLDDNEKSKKITPDLILLDLNMPKKNGRETLCELKSHPFYKRIPVIVYTTTRNEDEIRSCYHAGANTYIVKPSTYDGVKDVVNCIRNYWLATATTIATLN